MLLFLENNITLVNIFMKCYIETIAMSSIYSNDYNYTTLVKSGTDK